MKMEMQMVVNVGMDEKYKWLFLAKAAEQLSNFKSQS